MEVVHALCVQGVQAALKSGAFTLIVIIIIVKILLVIKTSTTIVIIHFLKHHLCTWERMKLVFRAISVEK